MLRFRIPDLYQICKIFSIELDETYERRPHEASDSELKKKRIVIMEIKLCKSVTSQNKEEIGYQDKLPEEKVEELTLEEIINFRPIRRGGRYN